MSRVLVTGASGNVGREVVSALQERGLAVTAASQHPAALRSQLSATVDVVRLDFHDRTTWSQAIVNQDHLFLMRPPAIADVENKLNPFVDAARAEGLQHVVFLSVAGAGKNKFVPHRKVEEYLRALNEHHTNLRPGFFAQNLQAAYRRDIVEDDRIYVPAGRRRVNWIDVRDVAEVAALIFDAPERHRAQDYTLTGPQSVSWSEVVRWLSEAVGRPIRYEPASLLGYILHLRRRGLPRGAIVVQTILHGLLRFGQGEIYDPTLQRLLGRPGRGVREYIFDHSQVWRKTW